MSPGSLEVPEMFRSLVATGVVALVALAPPLFGSHPVAMGPAAGEARLPEPGTQVQIPRERVDPKDVIDIGNLGLMEAEDELKKYGPVVKAPSGFPVQSPFLAVANRAMKQTKEFLAEFGMSPSARTRVAVTQARDTSNRFAKHAKRRGA